ncbi:putative proton/glutamate symporter [Oceanimonas sp. GK1]|uniref:dicarboxylate/amino acid:cation symporter n=1 Tax=Oceanimonas sp. (strain GK1 / IBRC-M 10197) TaxID=511062 RepID=UPI0002494E51|nr:dicarboxylate/amino acid:cation symporter [Oceanimonas sp. GK1]AEY02112.1 putative proton/glutamate symporter [Oceanimonas sp. GK1]
MNASEKKWSLTTRVLLGMGAGVLTGFVIRGLFADVAPVQDYLVNGLFLVGGKIFIASLNMLVVPLIFVSLVCGTSSLKDISTLGRLGGKTLILYLFTTAVAISLALGMGELFRPGEGADLVTASTFAAREAPSLAEVIINMFPTNPIHAMAEGNTLQIIVFAVLFGIAISLAGKPGERIAALFVDLNEVIMKLVALLMNLAPYGVFCLMAQLFTSLGLDAILNLIGYFLVLAGTLLLHALVTYSTLFRALTGLNPLMFFRKMEDAVMFAFSTASSNATIPVTLETTTRRMGVENRVASFTVPLGATINMDGTAIMQGVATAFIAQAFNIDLTFNDYLMVILTATLASVGTAGVPGVGLVMLAMVLNQVGLPVEGIALIIGVDRLLDMIRTAVNITGDAVVTCIVGKSEGAMNLTRFHDPHAGEKEEDVHFGKE